MAICDDLMDGGQESAVGMELSRNDHNTYTITTCTIPEISFYLFFDALVVLVGGVLVRRRK
jgi:hypothetical protein